MQIKMATSPCKILNLSLTLSLWQRNVVTFWSSNDLLEDWPIRFYLRTQPKLHLTKICNFSAFTNMMCRSLTSGEIRCSSSIKNTPSRFFRCSLIVKIWWSIRFSWPNVKRQISNSIHSCLRSTHLLKRIRHSSHCNPETTLFLKMSRVSLNI